jgi:hypothetical protein
MFKWRSARQAAREKIKLYLSLEVHGLVNLKIADKRPTFSRHDTASPKLLGDSIIRVQTFSPVLTSD